MQIKILDVLTPSDKQKAAGIHGTVNLGIENDGVLVTRLSGITIRKSGQGSMFMSEPSYAVGEGDNKKWYKHYNLYPGPRGDEGASQRQAKDKLTTEVLRVLESGGTKRRETGTTSNTSTANTGAPSTASSATAASDPWSTGS